MHDNHAGDDVGWIEVAALPTALLDRDSDRDRHRRARSPEARRALAYAILGVVCFGFVFGPLALALGQRARLAMVEEPRLGDAGVASAAITIAKMGFALHLAIVFTVLPWLLFALPLSGRWGD